MVTLKSIIYISPGNLPSLWADTGQIAIVNLFKNPLLTSNIAERAFQEVQNFTWDNRADQVLQFASKRLQEYRQH